MPDRPHPPDAAPGVTASRLVVAIDGPAGAGKSTVARAVASRLGLGYLDTGSMYRAVAWAALQRGVDPADSGAVAALAGRLAVTVGTDPAAPWVRVDGVDPGSAIREEPVNSTVSAVAGVAAVRRRLVAAQQAIAAAGGVVVEGRDIGTVVAPDAPVKVYLTATGDVRASRRSAELPSSEPAAVDLTREALRRRDQLDHGTTPLLPAPDAVELDTTRLGVGQVVEAVLELCRAAAGSAHAADAAGSVLRQ